MAGSPRSASSSSARTSPPASATWPCGSPRGISGPARALPRRGGARASETADAHGRSITSSSPCPTSRPRIKTYRDLGFTVVAGGRHPGVGTDNALIAFARRLVPGADRASTSRAPTIAGGRRCRRAAASSTSACRPTTSPGDTAVLRRRRRGHRRASSRATARRPDGVRGALGLRAGARPAPRRGAASSSPRRPGATSACRARAAHPNGVTGRRPRHRGGRRPGDRPPLVRARARRARATTLRVPGAGRRRRRASRSAPHVFEFLAPTGRRRHPRLARRAAGASPYAATLAGAARRRARSTSAGRGAPGSRSAEPARDKGDTMKLALRGPARRSSVGRRRGGGAGPRR